MLSLIDLLAKENFYETFARQMRSTGSPWLAALLLVCLGLVLLVAYWLSKRVAPPEHRPTVDDPQALFVTMLEKLELSAEQVSWLKRVAKDLHMQHPTVLLISAPMFDECVAKWSTDSRKHTASRPRIADPKTVALTRVMLFPE